MQIEGFACYWTGFNSSAVSWMVNYHVLLLVWMILNIYYSLIDTKNTKNTSYTLMVKCQYQVGFVMSLHFCRLLQLSWHYYLYRMHDYQTFTIKRNNLDGFQSLALKLSSPITSCPKLLKGSWDHDLSFFCCILLKYSSISALVLFRCLASRPE